MSIKELNPKEFSKTLAQQAMSYIPADVGEEQKQYIAKKVYEFCFITADHLIKQYNDQFTDEQAIVVVQFIGEWTFHKAIDLIRSGIRHEYWDTILQQVAFAALKGAIDSHSEGLDQQQTATIIENQVMEAYKKCILQLVKTQAIKEDQVESILSQSNVDKMAQESAEKNANNVQEDEKTLKCLAIALILKKMTKEKAIKILEKMPEDDKNKIISCLQIPDLEKKVDATVMNQYMRDLNKKLSSKTKPSNNEMVKNFKTLQDKHGEEAIINLTIKERSKIQEFLSNCLLEDVPNAGKVELSPYVVKILHGYLKHKLAS